MLSLYSPTPIFWLVYVFVTLTYVKWMNYTLFVFTGDKYLFNLKTFAELCLSDLRASRDVKNH